MDFSSNKIRSVFSPYLYLVFGFFLNMFPWGNSFWVPDFLLVMLAFWVLHSPEKVSFLSAFLLGLLMDIQTAQFLGIHAIVYVLVCFIIIYYQRKLLNASQLGQSIIMLIIFMMSQFILFLLLFIMGFQTKFSISYLIVPSVIDTILWLIYKKYFSSRISFLNHNQT
jgi:rod shape-determining protein MreD